MTDLEALADTYFFFEARGDGECVEVRPSGLTGPVFVFTSSDLEFIASALTQDTHPDLTWHVVPV